MYIPKSVKPTYKIYVQYCNNNLFPKDRVLTVGILFLYKRQYITLRVLKKQV